MTIANPERSGATPRRGSGWRSAIVVAAAALGGTLAGAGGVSYAALATGAGPWHGGHRLEAMQRHVRSALDGVGATTTQENKIHDILAEGFTRLGQDRGDREASRRQMLDLLLAPTIDRSAVEKLRADQVAAFDARSKTITGMLLDSADQLSPEQRAAFAAEADAMLARGPGHWHNRGEGRDRGPDRDGVRDRDGPHPEGGPNGNHAPGGDPG